MTLLSTNETILAQTILAANRAAEAAARAEAAGIPSGIVLFTIDATPPDGWLLMDDGTIGDVSSGAAFAQSTAKTIFCKFYNDFSDANCPLLIANGDPTTRAAQGDCDTAWAAHCRMTLPKILGRAMAASGTGASLPARTPGDVLDIAVTAGTDLGAAFLNVIIKL